jgi:hypothetical protein
VAGESSARSEHPSPSEKRPGTVVIAAAILIWFGLFEGMVVASVTIGFLFGTETTDAAAPSAGDGPFGPPMDILLRHDVELVAVQGAVGVASLVSGLGVWFGRQWARRCGQTAMAVHALLSLGVGVLMAVSLRSPTDSPVVAGALTFFRCAAIGVGVVWAAVASAPVWLLERAAADAWFRGRRRARRPS